MSANTTSKGFEEPAAAYAADQPHADAFEEPRHNFTNAEYVRVAGPYADLVRDLVESGEFEHPADVILEGLALLDEHHKMRKAMDAKLKAEIKVGLDQADRGELIAAEDVFARLRARLTARADK